MPPLVTALIIAFVASFAVGLLLPLLVLRVLPRRLRLEPAFFQGAARRWARLAAGPVVLASLAAPILFASQERVAAILPGMALMFLVGMADDVHTLPRWSKALALIIAAALCARMGISIDAVKPPFSSTMVPLGLFAFPITVLWVGAVTFGLVQTRALPGSICGLAAIAALVFMVVALRVGGPASAQAAGLAAAIAGTSLGYLRYDFFPPRLPVGSAACYTLAFAVAAVSVLGALKNTAFLILLLPILAVALPIVNTTYAVLYRSRASGQAIAVERRREFLHEALLRSGLSLRRCVVLFWLAAAYCGLLAYVLVVIITVSFLVKGLVLIGLGAAALLVFGIGARIASHPAALGGRVDVLDVPVDSIDMAQAIQRLEQFVRDRSPHMVVTPDASAIVRAHDDPELHGILRRADLVTPDGMGVVWMARVLGEGLRERVPGIDLMQRICQVAASRGYRIYLLGAAPGVAEQAAANLAARYPGLQVVGCQHGYFLPQEEHQVVTQVAAARPDILLVALGVPKQEKWIARHLQELNVPVAIGVGGSFDVLAGKVKRAPGWARACGLEWLWRSLREPRRLPRLLALPRFFLLGLRWLLSRRTG